MDKRIQVLQVSKSTGGVGQYLRMLVNGLDKSHFEVTVVCLSDGGEILAAELSKIDGVRALSLQMERYKINPLTDIRVWWQLVQIIRMGKFDVIHAHTSKPGFLARTAAFGTGIPTIYRPAGFSFHDGVAKWKAHFYATIERVVAVLFTTKIITVCYEERDLALRYHVGSEEQLTTIYTGVDKRRFANEFDRELVRKSLGVPDDAFLVGTVGRLSKQKAPADFIQAAALVHQEYPRAQFVWIGDGELFGEAQELVRSLAIEDVFHFTGYRSDIANILRALDCFVLASHWEGFSLSVLEAMAASLPVIVSRVSGAREAVVEGETGRLVSVGDVKELAEAIVAMVANPEFAKSLGKAGRLRMEQHFTLECMVKKIETLYIDLSRSKMRAVE